MSRRGENIRKRKDGRWEGRYIKGYDSKKQKARYASVYGKTYAETKQKLDEAKYKSSIGVVYVDAKNKLFGEIINSWFNAKKNQFETILYNQISKPYRKAYSSRVGA